MTFINSDCLDAMGEMDANSISCIVTDPPYGLKFMSKEWDHGIPGAPFWEEALRICKPGSHLLAFGGTRTYHRLVCAIEDSGWEIRDCLMWLYGSGFPKSHNHFGLEGYGTALKPAYEPIIMAMKPCDGTFKQNVEKWGQGGINIDECRVETEEVWKRDCRDQNMVVNALCERKGVEKFSHSKGRWPANVILDEEAGAMLDEQSGTLKSGKLRPYTNSNTNSYCGNWPLVRNYTNEASQGGASRFFYCAKASPAERNEGLEELPLKDLAGCYGEFAGDGRGRQTEHKPTKNNHPTVKPLKLMEYLIKLVMPPEGGVLLDPFAGSGTTVLAAKRLGFDAIGIEKDEGYCKIAETRCEIKPPDQYELEL